MNNSVFGKTMENVRKHRDIKVVTTDEKRNILVSEPNYNTKKRKKGKSKNEQAHILRYVNIRY